MRLLIDVGNTRIKWALVDPAQPVPYWDALRGMVTGWRASGAVLHADCATLIDQWQAEMDATTSAVVTDAAIANVAGTSMQQQLGDLLQQCGVALAAQHWFAATADLAGVHNAYRTPTQLGCDRFAALIGAHGLFGAQRVIVVSCGTATTIDALEADGTFIGGMILPGLAMMATSLARHTAQLPQIDPGAAVPALFADHTDAALASGCLQAQCGAILRALDAFDGAICLLAGGAAGAVAAALPVPYHLVDNLVLPGLQVAFSKTDPT